VRLALKPLATFFRGSLLCVVLLAASGMAQAEEFTTKIIAVLDGDTVLIKRGAGVLKIRLVDIDAPEVGHAGMGGKPPNSQKDQPFGASSQQSLSGMVLGKQVNVVSRAMDQYGRMVAHLSVNGLDVNTEQIRLGMAWAAVGWRQSRRVPTGVPLAGKAASSAASRQSSRDTLHSNHELIALEAEARQAERGLWAMSSPIPPWDWRKQHATAVMPEPVPMTQNAVVRDASCGDKKHCSQMSSCEEARHYLTVCGLKYLDGDRDGTPCEKLCAPHAQKNEGPQNKSPQSH
jgi:endonuclease YncB( thermonuclease family)